MRAFRRDGDQITAELDADEVDLLDSLVTQLMALLQDSNPSPDLPSADEDADDPFTFWGRDLEADPDQPEEPDDPALRLLFPTAYPHDAQAASDFRRFTQSDLYDAKIAAVRVVREDLAATSEGRDPVVVVPDRVEAWLKALTSLRLVLGSRLGIADTDGMDRLEDLDDDDPRVFAASVFSWLGFLQETLVEAL